MIKRRAFLGLIGLSPVMAVTHPGQEISIEVERSDFVKIMAQVSGQVAYLQREAYDKYQVART